MPNLRPTRSSVISAGGAATVQSVAPDDYLEMINPLWTTKELRGKVERVEPQGSEAASVLIRPGYEWPGHKPGQYVRLGVVIDGRVPLARVFADFGSGSPKTV